MLSESRTSTTFRSATNLSGPKLICNGLMQSGKVCCGLTSQQTFWGQHGCYVLQAKEEKDHPDCYQLNVLWAGNNVGHICCHPDDNKTMPSHILHVLLHKNSVWVLDWLACSPDLSPTKMRDALWSKKYDNRDCSVKKT